MLIFCFIDWPSFRVIIFTIGIPLGLCAWWGVGSFLRKHKSSKYVAYGFLAVISGGFIKLGQGLGLLPTNFLSDNAIYVAIIVQILFFSLGLASLINNLRKDAQQQSAMLADVNQFLERRVKDKTKELREYVEKIEILINNMAQAVFAINPDGIIIDPVSQFSEKIFGEKIEGNGTNLTLNSGADINLTATADVNIPAQVGLTFGADTEKIEVDGSNNMSIIANGDITLHPGGNNVLPGGDNEDDLGAADTRWRNIFTADMHFSNMGTDGNDVDGSTGNWTLQEGDENIFMKNNRTGKRYKINLTEV